MLRKFPVSAWSAKGIGLPIRENLKTPFFLPHEGTALMDGGWLANRFPRPFGMNSKGGFLGNPKGSRFGRGAGLAGEPVWPGDWVKNRSAGKSLREDLKKARQAWLADGGRLESDT